MREFHSQFAETRDVARVLVDDIAQVEQHVRCALSAAHEVDARGDHLANLAAARQAPLHRQLVEIERGVDAVLVEAQLTRHFADQPLAILQRDLGRLAQAVLQAVD